MSNHNRYIEGFNYATQTAHQHNSIPEALEELTYRVDIAKEAKDYNDYHKGIEAVSNALKKVNQ